MKLESSDIGSQEDYVRQNEAPECDSSNLFVFEFVQDSGESTIFGEKYQD